MKKIILLLSFLSFVLITKAQTLIEHDFNTNNVIPTGWTPYTTSGTQNWQVGLTNTINGENLTGHLEFGDNSKETYVRFYYRFELIP